MLKTQPINPTDPLGKTGRDKPLGTERPGTVVPGGKAINPGID